MDHSSIVRNMLGTDDDYDEQTLKVLKKSREKKKKHIDYQDEEDYDD